MQPWVDTCHSWGGYMQQFYERTYHWLRWEYTGIGWEYTSFMWKHSAGWCGYKSLFEVGVTALSLGWKTSLVRVLRSNKLQFYVQTWQFQWEHTELDWKLETLYCLGWEHTTKIKKYNSLITVCGGNIPHAQLTSGLTLMTSSRLVSSSFRRTKKYYCMIAVWIGNILYAHTICTVYLQSVVGTYHMQSTFRLTLMTSSKLFSSSFRRKLSRVMPAALTAIQGGAEKSCWMLLSNEFTLELEETSTS